MNDFAAVPQYEPKLLSATGRIGRLRYIAYSAMISLLLIPIAVVVSLLAGFLWDGLAYLLYVAAIPFAVMSVLLAKRRFNDLDASGWWVVAMFIPLLNLGVLVWMMGFAGKDSVNRFGPPPAPNTRTVKIFAWIYFGLMALGLVAAIGVGVYQQNLMRADAARGDIEARY